MASDIWLRTILIVRKETRCRHIGYSFRLTARVLLYAPSHKQDSTCHGLCYTSSGALAGTRNSSMGPPHEGSIRRPIALWANALTTELHLAPSIGASWLGTWADRNCSQLGPTPKASTEHISTLPHKTYIIYSSNSNSSSSSSSSSSNNNKNQTNVNPQPPKKTDPPYKKPHTKTNLNHPKKTTTKQHTTLCTQKETTYKNIQNSNNNNYKNNNDNPRNYSDVHLIVFTIW